MQCLGWQYNDHCFQRFLLETIIFRFLIPAVLFLQSTPTSSATHKPFILVAPATNTNPPWLRGTCWELTCPLQSPALLTCFCRRVTNPLHQHFKNSPPATNPHVFHLDFGEVLYPQSTHPPLLKHVTLSEKSAPFPTVRSGPCFGSCC